MRINIGFSEASIEAAIKQAESFLAQRKNQVDEYLDRLASVGENELLEAYGASEYTMYEKPTTVKVRKSKNSRTLVARGESIAFIEFGAGDGAGYSMDVGIDVRPGSWSESDLGKGEYSNKGYWHYRGEKFYGISPANGFTKAAAAIQRESPQIAREVFG